MIPALNDVSTGAWVILITNVVIFLTAALNTFLVMRAKKTTVDTAATLKMHNDMDIADQNDQLDQIHVLVNNRLTQAVNDIRILKNALDRANIPQPVTSSLLPPPETGPMMPVAPPKGPVT